MSLQAMISGADCAVVTNPLHQMLKHADGDHSVQRDRVAEPSSRLHHLPFSSSTLINQHDLQMARQFFDESPHTLSTRTATPIPYIPPVDSAMMGLQSAAHNPVRQNWVIHPNGDKWKSQDWSSEFSIQSPGVQNQTARELNYQPSTFYRSNFPVYGYGSSPYAPIAQVSDNKGKNKMSQADFDAAFASFDQEQQTIDANLDLSALADTLEATKISDEVELDIGKETDPLLSFQRLYDEWQDQGMAPPADDLARWEADYNALMSQQREGLDFGADMERYWNQTGGYTEENGLESVVRFEEDGTPILGPYVFERDNPFLQHPSPLAEAKAVLARNGSLTEAALLLETAIQRGDFGEGGYEAWVLLGETWSMDEREEQAIRALLNGVKIAQEAGAPGVGMVSLAVSFTNEAYEKASYSMLLRWLRAKYPSFMPSPELPIPGPGKGSWVLREEATDAFLAIAREQHQSGSVDPDLQVGLGVLLYTAGDFDRAKDCFESALLARPNDYLLWNRYGSCLSNGNKPEEALGAYREALNIRPTYTRAIYNVGVACLNIGMHKEAAEHLLSGLALQLSSGGSTSEQLWTTLRRCLITMSRNDLAQKAQAGTDLSVFRSEGFEFQ